MINKKLGVLVLGLISLMLLAGLVSADLTIKKNVVSSIAVPELDLPAIFNIALTNNGASDAFSIYSLTGIDMEPNESFAIGHGETQTVTVTAMPTFTPQTSPHYYSFEYKIAGKNTAVQSDQMAITIAKLKDAFNFYVDDINPESTSTVIHFENKGGHAFDNVKVVFSSAFFTQNSDFAVNAYESKKIEVHLNEKIKELTAGPYIINAEISSGGITESTSTIMDFAEKPEISTTQSSKGIIIHEDKIEKKNNGNVNTDVSISVSKNLFSSLFTSFNIVPNRKEINGFTMTYTFKQNLAPSQSLLVEATTNWWILVGIIVVIGVIWYFIDEYIRNKVVVKKSVSFVKTKGGEFALKVSLNVRARDFIEKIKVFDRLPPMVKVFERYGLIKPDRVDSVNRRLEWNIPALGKGEERIFNYIVYSKIGVVGKFELPSATSVYEYKGKIREASSNRAIYSNEPVKKDE